MSHTERTLYGKSSSTAFAICGTTGSKALPTICPKVCRRVEEARAVDDSSDVRIGDGAKASATAAHPRTANAQQ